MPNDVFDGQLVRVERNPWIMGLAAIPLVLGIALAAFSAIEPAAIAGPPYPLVLLLGALSVTLAWRRNFRPVTRPVHVRADATGIRLVDLRETVPCDSHGLGGAFVARRNIRAGFVKPIPGATRVLLQRRGLPIELQTAGLAEARGVLRALGLDVTQAVADFYGPSRMLGGARFLPMAGIIAVFTAAAIALHGTVLSPIIAMAMMGFVMAVLIAPTHLRIGADGIEMRWLLTRRFLPYGQVATVNSSTSGWGNSRVRGLRFVLRSGGEVFVPLQRTNLNLSDDKVALIEERIREAREAVLAGDVAVDAALLQRGERDVKDWIADLRSIGTGANATLRTAPVPRERLMRIALDPTQAAPARAAAAVALGGELDEETRSRLRTAAEATAAPKLRVAIEKAATGAEDGDIEEALREVEQEAGRRGRA